MRRSIVWLVAALLLAGGGGLTWWLLRPTDDVVALTDPPTIDTTGADPVVADAIAAARKQVGAQPQSPKAWGELAMVLLAHEYFADAVVCFAQAERLEPANPQWPYLAALAMLGGDPQPDRAIDALQRAAQLADDRPEPLLKLGEVSFAHGRPGEAERAFATVLRADPDNARAHLGMGRLCHQRGQLDAAVKHLTAADQREPYVKATHLLLAEIHHQRGDTEAAERSRRWLVRLPDQHRWPDVYDEQVLARWVGVRAQIDRAAALFADGQRAAALDMLQKTVTAHPDALMAHLALGRMLLEAGYPKQAEQSLRRATHLSPSAFEAWVELGAALRGQSRHVEALACFDKALVLKPDYAPAHFRRGQCLRLIADHDAAMKAFRQAVRCEPGLAAAHRELGQMLAQDDRFADALPHLQRAVQLNPDDTQAKDLLAYVERKLSAPDE